MSGQSTFSTESRGETTRQHGVVQLVAQTPRKRSGVFKAGRLQSSDDQGYDLRSLVGSFNSGVHVNDNYDSRPSGMDSSRNNVTVMMSVGYII